MDYSTSLLVKQASARAKELVVERQIISIQQQIEMSANEEDDAVLEENKELARFDAVPHSRCATCRSLCDSYPW